MFESGVWPKGWRQIYSVLAVIDSLSSAISFTAPLLLRINVPQQAGTKIISLSFQREH